jgi:hypothetical protein
MQCLIWTSHRESGDNGYPFSRGNSSELSWRVRDTLTSVTRAVCEAMEVRRFLSTSAVALPEFVGHVLASPPPLDFQPVTPGGLAAPPYTPQQMRSAYGVSNISFGSTAGSGAGETIAIIDAYNDPNIVTDSEYFSSYYGLQQFNVAGGPTLKVLGPDGSTNYPTNDTGGGNDVEESLDVQWAHVIAPEANIVVYEADNNEIYFDPNSESGFNEALKTARANPAVSVVSVSYDGAEFSQETGLDSGLFTTPAGHQGITFLVATGDGGSDSGYSAYSPDVIAVGGTDLYINSNGSYNSETAWSGSNGGISEYESIPNYQTSLGGVNGSSTSKRNNPDVSMEADPSTGIAVYDSLLGGSNWWYGGGTSLATPMWAGLVSTADQGRALAGLGSLDGVSQTLPRLYALGSSSPAFRDITSGSNSLYSAGEGYDLVTGIGSPVANILVNDLAFSQSDFTVTNTNDSGVGSLRQAIIDANLYGGPADIEFNIPTSDPNFSGSIFQIEPQSQLPTLTDSNAVFYGSSQESYTGNTNGGQPVVYIWGDDKSFNGLSMAGSSDEVSDLGIYNFNGDGVVVTGYDDTVFGSEIYADTTNGILLTDDASETLIGGCTIGVEYFEGGYYASPNGDGILIDDGSDDNQIGGNTSLLSSYPNTIAGNTDNGIEIDGGGDNLIESNTIGEAVHGEDEGEFYIYVNSPNGGAGIYIDDGSIDNTIGGTDASTERNVISGNDSSGVHIVDDASAGNTIEGNYIGIDESGASYANGGGLYIHGESCVITDNVISGNSYSGVNLAGPYNTVSYNLIGTNLAGTAADGNAQQGVYITGDNNVVNENTISGNDQQGVMVLSTSDTISGNSIGLNSAYNAAVPNQLQGVLVTDSYNTISGDVIGGNVGAGISLEGGYNTVYYCYIGLNTSGGAVSNGEEGIYIDSPGNLIGGTSYAAAGNAISGNTTGAGYGILLDSSGATENYIEGNYIGTNLTGTTAVANNYGVGIQNSAGSNYIGNSSIAAGNVISGNTEGGIYFATTAGGDNLLTANDIGTNAVGTASIGSQAEGVQVDAPDETIGGSTTSDRNVISGNIGSLYAAGVAIGGIGSDTVQGNYIGTNAAGTAAIRNQVGVYVYGGASDAGIYSNVISGNSYYGLWITGSSSTSSAVQGNLIGTDDTGTLSVPNELGVFVDGDGSTIGGSASGQGNTIAYNTDGGIEIEGSTNASIAGNTIYHNTGYGVNNEATLSVDNSTIAGTVAGTIGITNYAGDGIVNSGTLSVFDTTVSTNGLGISQTGTATLENTIIAQNTTGDVTGALSAPSSYNLIGNGTGLTGISNGVNHDQVGTSASPINAVLGSLTNNGGTTETMLPAPSSPEINTGTGVSYLSTDQRGAARPTSGAVDIGSVQLQNIAISGSELYLRLATDGQTLDIYYNNTGAGAPALTYALANLSTLTATGTSGNDQLTVDYSNGIPIPPGTGFTYDGLGGTNTLEVIGTAGNDVIGYNASTVTVGASTVTYANVQNRIVQPLAGSDTLSIASGIAVSFPVAPAGGGFVTRTLASLTLANNASLTVPTAATRSTDRTLLIVQAATLGTGATLDLGGNDAEFTTASLATVNGWIKTGYNAGKWNGAGIDSSFAATSAGQLTGLGVIQNNQSGSALFTASHPFDSTAPGSSAVLVKYTYYGDANLDGKVDGSDYARIDNGYLNHLTGWFNGDFNYDGFNNGSDYTLIDNAYNTQGASLAAQVAPVTPAMANRAIVPLHSLFSQLELSTPAMYPTDSWVSQADNVAAGIFAADDDSRRSKDGSFLFF